MNHVSRRLFAALQRRFNRNIRANFGAGGGGAGSATFSLGNVNRDPKTFKVKNPSFSVLASGQTAGDFEESEVDFTVVEGALSKDSYVSESVRKHKELLLKSGYHFRWRNEQSYLYLQQRLAYMEAATGIPTNLLFQGIIDDLMRYGNCFMIKARAKKGVGLPPGIPATPILPAKEPIAGYFRMSPATVTIERDEYGHAKKYKQTSGNEEKEFAEHDVIHIHIDKMAGKAFAEPYFAPAIEDVRLLRKIEENVAILLYKHIFPLIMYKVGMAEPGKEATQEEIDDAQAQLESLSNDSGIVLPERHVIEGLKVDVIDVKPYLTYFEDRVLAGLDLSKIDIGRGDTANRNTADAMSSQKVDRVKGWQQQIAPQIDKMIIDELLIEGGFDPLINSEFDIDFVFNEIENEKKMALENHATQLWMNNGITFEEYRQELGRDPVADEARLYISFIGGIQSEQAIAQTTAAAAAKSENGAVDNKNQPENQHGKKAAAKEGSNVSIELKENKTYNLSESAMKSLKILENLLEDALFDIKQYANATISGKIKSNVAPLSNGLLEKKFLIATKSAINGLLIEGSDIYLNEFSHGTRGNVRRQNDFVLEYASEWFEKLSKDIKSDTDKILSSDESSTYKVSMIQVKIERYRGRIQQFVDYISHKTVNYGYLLTASYNQEGTIYIESDNGCGYCKSMADTRISTKLLSDYEEKALFYKLPPYHSNCKCQIRGGE